MNKFRIVKVTHYNHGIHYRVEEFIGKNTVVNTYVV